MKRKICLASIQLLIGLFLSSGYSSRASAAVLSNVNVFIPYGDSVLEQYIGTPQYAGPLQVTYLPSPSCPGVNLLLEVRSAQTGYWYSLAYVNGSFTPIADPIDSLRLRFSQYGYQSLTCNITVSSLNTYPQPPSYPNPYPQPNPGPAWPQ